MKYLLRLSLSGVVEGIVQNGVVHIRAYFEIKFNLLAARTSNKFVINIQTYKINFDSKTAFNTARGYFFRLMLSL